MAQLFIDLGKLNYNIHYVDNLCDRSSKRFRMPELKYSGYPTHPLL